MQNTTRHHDNVIEAISRWGDALYKIALSLTKNQEDAEDLIQELWLKILKKPSSFTIERLNSYSFLRTTLCNLFRDRWRRKSKNPVSFSEDPPELIASQSYTGEPLTIEEHKEAWKKFRKEYPVNLTDEQWDICFLFRLGYTIQEISNLSGRPKSTVWDIIRDLRKGLRRLLNKENV